MDRALFFLPGMGTSSLFICPWVMYSTAWQMSLHDPRKVQVSPATKINRTGEIQAFCKWNRDTKEPALERARGYVISWRLVWASAEQLGLIWQCIQIRAGSVCLKSPLWQMLTWKPLPSILLTCVCFGAGSGIIEWLGLEKTFTIIRSNR